MTDVSTFPAIAGLVIFCLSIAVVLALVFSRPVVRIPLRGRKPLVIHIRYYVAPVAAVLAMLACQSMTIADVGRGLLGNDQIQPYGILLLFMSMAYIAGALDASGIFAWLALKFTYMSGGRGRVLFLFYFLLSSFITTFTSNDVCILTLTPIVCYFAKATRVDPMPFLFAEYAAANTFGALLYTGNPTNIIVAQAYDMTFLGYSKWMSLPTLAGGIGCFLMLLVEYGRVLPVYIPLPTVDASHMLRDRLGAIFGSVNMLTCLGLLAAAPSLGWSMWAITLVCAGVHAVYNLWAFRTTLLHFPIGECWTCGAELDEGADEGGSAAGVGSKGEAAGYACTDEPQPVVAARLAQSGDGGDDIKAAVRRKPALSLDGKADAADPANCKAAAAAAGGALHGGSPVARTDSGAGACTSATPSATGSGYAAVAAYEGGAASSQRSVARAGGAGAGQSGPVTESEERGAGALPVTDGAAVGARTGDGVCAQVAVDGPDVPPAAPEETTVDSLRGKTPTFWSLFFDLPWEVVPFALGFFVEVECLYVQGWLDVFGSGLGIACRTLPAAIFIIGFLSVALANTINNQPMTILLTRVLLSETFTSHVGFGNIHKAALFALVLGSNIGAVFTMIGALAGILWSNIMGIHGLTMTYGHFARVCCPVGFVTLVASLLVLWFEFAVFP